jgi:hypothetical protein
MDAPKTKADRTAAQSFAQALALGLLVLLLFAGASYWLMQFDAESPYGKLGLKMAEFLVQVALVVVAGGIFMQNYNRLQARKTAINEFRKETLGSLATAYSDVKRARRNLRAKTEIAQDATDEQLAYAAYDAQLSAINDTQLALEVVKRELDVFSTAFDAPEPLAERVRAMEKYLGKLVDEYEQALRQYRRATHIPVAKLVRLSAFVGHGDHGDFAGFSEAFHDALALLQTERIKLQ